MGQMPPNIIIDENEKDIRIKPNIAGTEVVLYGAMPSGKKDIIIEVVGPARNISLEEKRGIYGFWLGLGRADYFQVPSYYNIMSSKKLSEIADQSVFDKLRLGVINLPLGNAKISNTKTNSVNIKGLTFKRQFLSSRTYPLNILKFLATEQSITMDGSPLAFMVEFLGYGCRATNSTDRKSSGSCTTSKMTSRKQPIWLLRIPNCWKSC